MIAAIISSLRVGSFFRQTVVLTAGTLLGRAIAVIAMPALTRIYSPEDFSVLASYSAILSILVVVSCLRFEIAIPMPERDDEASALLFLSLSGTALVALAAISVLSLAMGPILDALTAVESATVLWLVPVGVVLAGSYQAFQYWATRQKEFHSVARTRVSQAVVGVGTMLILGGLSFGAIGLTLGHMLMSGAGALGLALHAFRRCPHLLRNVTLAGARRALSNYRRFPTWSLLEALANVVGLQVPVLIIAANAPEGEAGQLMIAMQVMLLPMALIGSSIGQVYLSRAPQQHRDGTLGPFTIGVIRRLALTGALPIAAIGLSAPWVFPYIFGVEWARSGQIAAMMVPGVILQFVVGPIFSQFHVLGRLKEAMSLQIAGAVIRIGAVSYASSYYPDSLAASFSAAIFASALLFLIPLLKLAAK